MAMCGCDMIFKIILTHFSMFCEMVGLAFLGFGLWGKNNHSLTSTTSKDDTWFQAIVWILIVQGPLMVIMGLYSVYSIWTEKMIGVKVFSFFLAVLALADIIIGMTHHFTCVKDCTSLHPSIVLGVFLGTAVVMLFALVCTIIFIKQNRD